MALTPGTRLGPYEIAGSIGAGGMGEVYRARDTRLGREVAIKILPDAFAEDADRLARFEREARTLATLNHPHIAQIYGLEESGGLRALAMELVDGDDLAERLRAGPMAIDDAMPIARQIADALEAAHAQGIVHRDLKPANIKVRNDGTVKVLDFGLAKAMDGASGAGRAGDTSGKEVANSPTITTPAMTAQGVILGTAAYMAPEQAKGRPVDKRADIWAFGCVLFEMLAGQRAFPGEDVSDTLALVLRGEPDWSALPESTPADLLSLIKGCLIKDRAQRIADLAVARFLLSQASMPMASTVRPRGSRSSSLIARAALVLLAVAVAAGAFVVGLQWRQIPTTPVSRLSVLRPPGARIFGSSGALSPDGQHLAMTGQDDRGVAHVWLRSRDALEWRQLPGTEGASSVFWSPDSKRVGFLQTAERKLKKVDLVGGAAETICTIPSIALLGGASWSSNGTIVLVPSREANGVVVHAVSADGGDLRPVTTLEPGENRHVWPYFLPDGRRFLYLSRGATPDTDSLYVGSSDGGTRVRITTANSRAEYANGYLFYLRGSNLVAQAFDMTTARLAGDPSVVGENVGADAWGSGDFSVSRTDVLHWGNSGNNSSSNNMQLVWQDRSGRQMGSATDEGFYRTFDLSHDDRRVITHAHDTRTTMGNLWLVDIGSKTTSRFTEGASHDLSPIWSPDGSRVAFVSTSETGTAIVEKGLGAGAPLKQLATSPNSVRLMRWSTDGRFILYVASGPGVADLFALDLSRSGAPPIPVANSRFDERWGDLSPDGRWVALQSDESGRREIYIQSFPLRDTRVRVSRDGGSEPRWSSDGKEVFFVGGDGQLASASLVSGATPAVGQIKPLFPIRTNAQADATNHYRVSHDGQRVLVLADRVEDERGVTLVLNWPQLIGRSAR